MTEAEEREAAMPKCPHCGRPWAQWPLRIPPDRCSPKRWAHCIRQGRDT